MYSVEMSPSVGAAAVAMELPAPGAMRELSDEELLLVSGASWSWSDFGGAAFAGAVTGGMAGSLAGGGGALPGMVGGALLGGGAYAAVYAWDGAVNYFFGC